MEQKDAENRAQGEITPFGLDPQEAAAWRLTFDEEFDAPALDETKWYAGYRNGQFEYYKRVGALDRQTRSGSDIIQCMENTMNVTPRTCPWSKFPGS